MDEGVPVGLTRSENRKFGLTVGPAFLLLAGLLLWRQHELPAYVAAALGSLLVVVAAASPMMLRPVFRGWMKLALALSKVTTPVVMALMYFLVFTPFGLVMRAFGRNPLVRPAGTTYWVTRPEGKRRSDLNRQF